MDPEIWTTSLLKGYGILSNMKKFTSETATVSLKGDRVSIITSTFTTMRDPANLSVI